MKLLIVDDASGYAAPFPGYQVYIIDPPFDFEVNLDPLGNTLPKDQFTDEQREIINTLCDEAAKNPLFVVNSMMPLWIEKGREQIEKHGVEDPSEFDDETLAICYLTQSLMVLTGCSAIYNPIWF